MAKKTEEKTDTEAVVEDILQSREVLSFDKYVEKAIPSIHVYTKAYLDAMYRGQIKQVSDWEKEPEIAALLKE
jgi:hypothetical protein